jgi:SNF2 family DNA or RNA helicase
MEMGLGKTVTTLTALADMMDRFDTSKVLLVAPLRVAQYTWPDEIAKWTHTRDIPYSVITETQKQRIAALASKAPVHIVNFDNLVWLVKHVLTTTGGRWPYDQVIVDESSWVKNPASKRAQALVHVRPAIERMIQLTGSPAGNGLLNLWNQLYLLDYGERLGNTQKAMKDRWFEVLEFTEYGPVWGLRMGASEEIHQRVSDIALSLRSKDYLDMPDTVVVPVYYDLPPNLRAQYDKLERDLWIEVGEKGIEAVNGGAASNKCRQFVNGFVYDEEKTAHKIHSLKLELLKETVDEAAGQNILLGYQYKPDRRAIEGAFPQALHVDGDNALERWNRGTVPLLLAHPKSAGHGLNLQDGGHLVIMYGLDWSLELYEQLVARLARQGQRYPVIVYLLMARNTIDELMWLRIQGKDEVQSNLKSAVHSYQKMRKVA